MKTIKRLIVVAAALALASPVFAQTGGGYDLTWDTTSGGGVMAASGGSYSLGTTIGQADVGVASGGGYTLSGGFWYVAYFRAYLPSVRRG